MGCWQWGEGSTCDTLWKFSNVGKMRPRNKQKARALRGRYRIVSNFPGQKKTIKQRALVLSY